MSKTTTFEAWAVQMSDSGEFLRNEDLPWFTSDWNTALAESVIQIKHFALMAKSVRVRVTVEVIEEG